MLFFDTRVRDDGVLTKIGMWRSKLYIESKDKRIHLKGPHLFPY